MSGVAIIRYKLANAAGVTALAPAMRIMAGPLPLDTAMPAISVSEISSVRALDVSVAESMRTDRVQVTVFAKTYPEVRTILSAIDTALPYSRGTVNGHNCDSIIPDVNGPDGFDDQLSLHFKSRDYFVRWNA